MKQPRENFFDRFLDDRSTKLALAGEAWLVTIALLLAGLSMYGRWQSFTENQAVAAEVYVQPIDLERRQQ